MVRLIVALTALVVIALAVPSYAAQHRHSVRIDRLVDRSAHAVDRAMRRAERDATGIERRAEARAERFERPMERRERRRFDR
jgi:hypothetical protein